MSIPSNLNTLSTRQRPFWPAVVLGVSSIYLYLRLFRLPCIPVLLGGDQVFFWSYAQRTLHGQLAYRDFFQITAPGADWIFAACFAIFGESIWVTDLLVIVAGVALTYLTFELSRLFVSNALAALSAFVYLVVIYARLLSGTHHLFAMIAVSAAALILLRRTAPSSTFLAGALFGLASVITQTHGIFAASAATLVIILSELPLRAATFRKLALLWAGFAAVLLPVEIYLAVKVGFARLWYCQVDVPSRWHGSSVTSAWWLSGTQSLTPYLVLLAIYALLPLAYLLTASRLLRGPRNIASALLLAIGVALLLEVGVAPNQIRIFSVALPAFVLLIALVDTPGKRRILVPLLWTLVAVFLLRSTWQSQTVKTEFVQTPAGRVATSSASAQKLRWLAAHLQNNDAVFEAAYPGVYLSLRRLDPVYADNVLPNQLTPNEITARTIAELDGKRIRYIIWNEALDAQPTGSSRVEFERFRSYVMENYRIAIILEKGEKILERR
jgi:Dolichyl-phosphate-mannose-protein mannosyltransferase